MKFRRLVIAVAIAALAPVGFLLPSRAQQPPAAPPVAGKVAVGHTVTTHEVVLKSHGGIKVRFTPRHRLVNPYPLRHLRTRKAFTIPATAIPVDSTGNMTVSCPMDDNDTLGDCGSAMIAHNFNIWTFGQGLPGWTEVVFNVAALAAQYEQVSGGDNGLDEDEVVNQIGKVGVAGNSSCVITDALDFDVTNIPLTQYLIDQFYSVNMAWSVPNDFLDNFTTATIWASADTPNPNNGHFTPLASIHKGVAPGTSTDITGYYELWTWGSYCFVSPAFVASVQPACFVTFSPKQFSTTTGLDSKGRHITTQAAAWVSIGGNPIPTSVIDAFPPLSPSPTPTPVPVPTPVSAGLTLIFDPTAHTLTLPTGYTATATSTPNTSQITVHPGLKTIQVPRNWTVNDGARRKAG